MSLLDDYAEYQSTSVHRNSDVAQGSNISFTGNATSGVGAVGSDADGFITTTLDAEDAPIFSLDT
ncbi:hypothetical protein FBU31_004177, partial [Coemansia sp. 'formosensis']